MDKVQWQITRDKELWTRERRLRMKDKEQITKDKNTNIKPKRPKYNDNMMPRCSGI